MNKKIHKRIIRIVTIARVITINKRMRNSSMMIEIDDNDDDNITIVVKMRISMSMVI